MNLDNVIAYGLLLIGALAFTLTNMRLNAQLNVEATGRTVTLFFIYAGVFVAAASLTQMVMEVRT